MTTDVLIYAKCGGESSASIRLKVSTIELDALSQIHSRSDIGDPLLEDHITPLMTRAVRNLEALLLVKEVNWIRKTMELTKTCKAFVPTLAGKLVAQAWSRNDD